MSMEKIVNSIVNIKMRNWNYKLDRDDIKNECYLLYLEADARYNPLIHKENKGSWIYGDVFGRIGKYINKQMKITDDITEYEIPVNQVITTGSQTVDFILDLIKTGKIYNAKRQRIGWNTIKCYLIKTLNYSNVQCKFIYSELKEVYLSI